MSRLTINNALALLEDAPDAFVELLEHGSMSVELYKPAGTDPQQPHDQDELYVIASGNGYFLNGDDRHPFEAGEVLFVRAGVYHRFEDFSEDFATWVIFYGPKGGE
ncbi:MAG: cupin domain-containing protein [Pseudomonadota bacterium]